MTIKKIRKIAILACAALISVPSMGQDLLARQAPVDRKLKAVDSVALRNLIQHEEMENPSESLYEEWDNKYAHKATALPDSFLIDLRGFHMPTDNKVVTSNFGARWGRQHKGIDVKVYIGDTIRAAFDGKIRIVRYEARGYGKYVVIRHHNGLETIYGHMSAWLVQENQDVKAGDPIGLGGNTGRSTGSHLHFETRLCGVALNPALMFDFRNQDVVDDFYMFRSNSHDRESLAANKVRGVQGKHYGDSEDIELTTAAPAATYSKDVRFHKVVRGETLASIARKRGTTVDEICKLNRIGKNIRLMPGQILKYN